MATKELYYRTYSYFTNNKKVHSVSFYDLEFFPSLEVLITDEKRMLETNTEDSTCYFFDGQKFIISIHNLGKFEFCVTEFIKYTTEQLESL